MFVPNKVGTNSEANSLVPLELRPKDLILNNNVQYLKMFKNVETFLLLD